MKRLMTQTNGTNSNEKTLNQGRLANMRKLNLRRLLSVVGVVAMLSVVYVTAYANVMGTERADVINSGNFSVNAGDTIFALGGNDTIDLDFTTNNLTVFGGPGNDQITHSTGGNVQLFGDNGNDTLMLDHTDTVQANGGRGDDFFNVTAAIDPSSGITDGPGSDVIRDSNGTTNSYTVKLVADNEQDTVILNGSGSGQQIRLSKGSGRDVIDCGGAGTVFLNGNRKATDTEGNNLRKAALLGGTAQTGCDMLIP